jgi:hypothetical protein
MGRREVSLCEEEAVYAYSLHRFPNDTVLQLASDLRTLAWACAPLFQACIFPGDCSLPTLPSTNWSWPQAPFPPTDSPDCNFLIHCGLGHCAYCEDGQTDLCRPADPWALCYSQKEKKNTSKARRMLSTERQRKKENFDFSKLKLLT